jgi:PBSX family phage portal protein
MPTRIRRVRHRITRASARVTSFSSERKRTDTSRQIDTDHTRGVIGGTAFIPPPYSIEELAAVFERSNMLRQCVAAMVTNVALTGFEVVPVSKDIPVDDNEKEILQSFIDNANSEQSLTAVHALEYHDYEKYGFGFMEVIRDRLGRVSLIRHARSRVTRVCPKNETKVLVQYDVLRGPRVSNVTEYRTFRIFVQIVGGEQTFFKEFGDPRHLDYKTGKFESNEYKVPVDRRATELIHFKQDSEDVYGIPRWINQLPSIMGSREAEEVNLRYFEDNTVPPMMITVSGGRLTGESFRELKKVLQNEGLGKERQNQIMLIEAVAERESLDDKGNVQLKVDKLTDSRQGDGLFKQYDEANQAKIRSSFRLPPVAVGLSQDVTFATANVSAFIAETQVYAPQRAIFDEMFNKRIVNNPLGLNLKTVCLRSSTPAITNPEGIVKSLTALNVMGAVTPRIAQEAANKLLQIDLPEYPQPGEEGYEDWMDKPIVFATSGKNTHAGQSVKDEDVKETEEDGDVTLKAPENGSQ